MASPAATARCASPPWWHLSNDTLLLQYFVFSFLLVCVQVPHNSDVLPVVDELRQHQRQQSLNSRPEHSAFQLYPAAALQQQQQQQQVQQQVQEQPPSPPQQQQSLQSMSTAINASMEVSLCLLRPSPFELGPSSSCPPSTPEEGLQQGLLFSVATHEWHGASSSQPDSPPRSNPSEAAAPTSSRQLGQEVVERAQLVQERAQAGQGSSFGQTAALLEVRCAFNNK